MIHLWPLRVHYEDVDLAAIVYYANYLKYLERGRSEMVREAGISQLDMKAAGLVFAVRRVFRRIFAQKSQQSRQVMARDAEVFAITLYCC